MEKQPQPKTKRCIECEEKQARHWDSSFCEECFRAILTEKLKNED